MINRLRRLEKGTFGIGLPDRLRFLPSALRHRISSGFSKNQFGNDPEPEWAGVKPAAKRAQLFCRGKSKVIPDREISPSEHIKIKQSSS